jgi:hypothetical protein
VVVTEVVDVVSHSHFLANGGGRRYTTFRYRKLKTEGDAKVGGTVSPVSVEDVDTDEMSRRISCGVCVEFTNRGLPMGSCSRDALTSGTIASVRCGGDGSTTSSDSGTFFYSAAARERKSRTRLTVYPAIAWSR